MPNYGISMYYQTRRESPTEAKFEMFQFPSGEFQVKDLDLPFNVPTLMVYLHQYTSDTLVALQVLLSAVEDIINVSNLHIDTPYLPASRSDRGKYSSLGRYLSLITTQFNGGGATKCTVTTLDAHNADAFQNTKIYGRVKYDRVNVTAAEIIQAVAPYKEWTYDGVIAPDEGAKERAKEVAELLGVPVYVAKKTRNFDTGKITGMTPPRGLANKETYLVVDDVCDGGGTFAGLLDSIDNVYGKGDIQVNPHGMEFDLWITHGVFSGNWESNLKTFHNIYTTDSLPTALKAQSTNNRVFVYPVESLMNGVN